ncbi:MAG: hypothetical protein KJ667_06600, partial [Alphaproteobacteria bacterium]|nr:hypothetical protein [Alphaproteobacteria bacterium]
MTKKTNNTPKHFPSLALLFATGRAQAVNDSIMLDDEEAARHAVSGIENISYGYGEDGEGIDLMQNFAAISNPVDGTWVVVARP